VFPINFRFKEIYTKMCYLEVLALIKKDRRGRKSALFY